MLRGKIMTIRIRMIKIKDSNEFLKLCQKIDNESSNMLLSPGERQLTIADQEKKITEILSHETSNIWVAENDTKLIGYLIAIGNVPIQKIHCSYIVIGVLQEFTKQGIGTNLFKHLLYWAKQKSLSRLELTVRTTNKLAISLYKKMGFVEEGIKRNSLFINSEYEDELYMAKIKD
jgi:RimJ/RimL family protein N-acetyltransferase